MADAEKLTREAGRRRGETVEEALRRAFQVIRREQPEGAGLSRFEPDPSAAVKAAERE